MRTTVAAWNVAGGFGDERKTPALLEQVKRLDADVVVLTEAFDPGGDFIPERELKDEGYVAVLIDRQLDDTRKNRMIAMLSRVAFTHTVAQLGIRQGVSMRLHEADMRIVGVHFDDKSEEERHAEVTDFYLHVAKDDVPAVLAGDLNAMHGDDKIARYLKKPLFSAAANHVPSDRFRDISTRLIGMADGRTMRYLTQSYLSDADPQHQPTWGQRHLPPVAQLDHILYNQNHIGLEDFSVHERITSDHRPIMATLEV